MGLNELLLAIGTWFDTIQNIYSFPIVVPPTVIELLLIKGVTPEQQFIKVMNDELVEIMGSEQAPLASRTDGNPTVILLAGLQGTGKTTAAAKLAKCAKIVLLLTLSL